MEKYKELKSKLEASIDGGKIIENNDVIISQTISDFNTILNTSNTALSAACDDLSILIPLLNKYVLSKNIKIRQASVPVFVKLQNLLVENLQVKSMEWWKKYKSSLEQNCCTLLELRNSGCDEWPTIWCTLVKLLGDDIHSSISLTNSLLRIVEKAFKDKSDNQDKERQTGFQCWKSMVDGFALTKEPLSKRRVEFLLMPLKAPNHSSKVVCESKLQAWLHTLTKMGNKEESYIDIVLPPLVDYMFVGSKLLPAAYNLISASRCADEFISILKMQNVFKRQPALLVATTATCIESVKDNPQLLQLVWINTLDAVRKLVENIGADKPEGDVVLTELVSVIDKLSSTLPREELVKLMLMCIQGKCKLLPLKSKFQMLFEIIMKPKIVTKLDTEIYNVIQALFCLYMPKERTEKIFKAALDAVQVAATNTENNDAMTNILHILGDAWIAIVDSLIESVQWILSENKNQFIYSCFLFPLKYLVKNGVWCNEKLLSSWRNLLCACIKTSEVNKKNVINEFIKHLANLDTELYSTSLEVINTITDTCESFDAIPYYSGVIDGLLKKSNDNISIIIQSLCDSMLKYAKKNNTAASKLLEIADQLNNSKHDVLNASVKKNLSKFHNNMSSIENTTPEKSSKFLHRLAKAKEIQSQNNNRSPTSSPVGLFQFNSAEKKKFSPSMKTSRKTIDEESSQEFVMVPPKPKKTVLTNHQKERLSTRRCDIPALYQDLSQDTQSMDSILTVGTINEPNRSNLAKINKCMSKDDIIQSVCEDAIDFNCSKPATIEEPSIKENTENEAGNTSTKENNVHEKLPECRSDVHRDVASVETHQNSDSSSKKVSDISPKLDDMVACKIETENNVTNELKNESDALTKNIDSDMSTSISQKLKNENECSETISKLSTDESNQVQKITRKVETEITSANKICKENNTTKSTPIRKSVRRKSIKISPNKTQLLGKRRSITSSNVVKSPPSSKKSKLQSRKSIARVESDLKELPQNDSDSHDGTGIANSNTNSPNKCVVVIVREDSQCLDAPVNPSVEGETEKVKSQGRKSVSKQRKRPLGSGKSTTSPETNKSPTIKKRLRKSLGANNLSQSSTKVIKNEATNKKTDGSVKSEANKKDDLESNNCESQLPEIIQDTVEVKNEFEEVENNILIGITDSLDQNKSSTLSEKSKDKSISSLEKVSEPILLSTQLNEEVEKEILEENVQLSNKSFDVTPTRQRLTPRIKSKKKSPCACCSEEKVPPSREKRKDSLSRSLFDQVNSTPTQKIKRKPDHSTEIDSKQSSKKVKDSINVLSEIDCSSQSIDNNSVTPLINSEVSLASDNKNITKTCSTNLDDSETIDIHISEKEKMEIENSVVENDDEKENQCVSKTFNSGDSHNQEKMEIEASTVCSDTKNQPCPAEEENNQSVTKHKDEAPIVAPPDQSRTCAELRSTSTEENDTKNNIETNRSKNMHKGLDSWVIRSPRVDKSKGSENISEDEEYLLERKKENLTAVKSRDSQNISEDEENLERKKENLTAVCGISDSDDSYVDSSQEPSDSVIKKKRKLVEKDNEIENPVAINCSKENEKCHSLEKSLSSEEISNKTESRASKQSSEKLERKSDTFSKLPVCRRLLDNLNNEEKQTCIENHEMASEDTSNEENVVVPECDLSFINDEKYCEVIAQEVFDIEVETSTDHDYIASPRNPKVKTVEEIEVGKVDCEKINKSPRKSLAPAVEQTLDLESTVANSTPKIAITDSSSSKKSKSALEPSKCDDKKAVNSSSPDRNINLGSPSRASRIKRLVLASAIVSPTKNAICNSPLTRTKEALTPFSSPDKGVATEESAQVISPPTAYKTKQSASPEQSSYLNNKQILNNITITSPSRSLKIKRLLSGDSSSPKRVLISSPDKILIENGVSCTSPPRTSRLEKQLNTCSDHSPGKVTNSDAPEKNSVLDGLSSVTNSPQSTWGRTAQLMGLANGDSPAQFRRHQITPKRIRPVRIMTVTESGSHEGEDWVCKTYSPSAVPSPGILKPRFKSDDISPQSSPGLSKSKISDDQSETSPPTKKKRVNFHDPPLTQKLFFYKTGAGKVVTQGKSSEAEPKSSEQEAVTVKPTTASLPMESSCCSNSVIDETKRTFSDTSVNTDSKLRSDCTYLRSIWNNFDRKEKRDFILGQISESDELLDDVLGNLNSDLEKQILSTLCNEFTENFSSKFASLICSENILTRYITENINSISNIISKSNDESQLRLLENVSESVKIKLLDSIPLEKRVTLLSNDLRTYPNLLKEIHKNMKLEDVAGDIASQIETSSELGELVLEKTDVNKVADLLISGINILKMKR